MKAEVKSYSIQKKATVVSSIVALILVTVKLVVGIVSGSVVVLASAIDSLLDMIVSIFNFFAISKSEEASNENYPYGKGKVQAIAAVIEGTVITLSGLYIIYIAVEKWLDDGVTTLLSPAIAMMCFSIVVTYLLVRYLLSIAKKTDNLVIKADALHYQTDLWSNSVVLLALVLVSISGFHWIDALFGIGIGIYIMYSAYGIIVEGIEVLLDKALSKEIVEQIDTILASHAEVTSYHWLKTRTDGTANFVEFHMVLRPKMLLLEAHRIADEVEDKIKALEPQRVWIITPHFDPYDDEAMNDAIFQ